MLTIKTDSRKVKPGDTFVALRGISSDGHDYIEKAIKAGATKIIAEEGNYEVDTQLVKDSRLFLEDLLHQTYQNILEEMTIIGITGTNGKTTTAYLLYEALNRLGRKTSYAGTIGFYMEGKVRDLPNTSPDLCDIYDMIITSYEAGYRIIVLEVSSQGLSYHRLNQISFDYAIFTNLTQDHLDYHKTMENYAKAKQQLFYQLKDNGKSIINVDDSYHSYFMIKNVITYGFSKSDYQVKDAQIGNHGTSFMVNQLSIHTTLLGRYNLYNVLCATIVLDLLGFSKSEIENTIPFLLPPPGRMEIIPYDTNKIIIDYAHTPDAMENLFKTIQEIPHQKTYVVFGCTGSRDAKKRPIMMQLALKNADYVIVTSDDLHEEEFVDIVKDMLEGNIISRYKVEQNRFEAVKEALKMLKQNDLLLILGKGHEEYIIVKEERIPYNDRKAVEQILKSFQKIEIES